MQRSTPFFMITPAMQLGALLAALLAALPVHAADKALDSADKKTTASMAPATPSPFKAKARLVKGTLHTHKTSLGIRVDYSFVPAAEGAPTEVRLTVEGNEEGRPLTLEITPGQGLRTVRGLVNGAVMQTAAAAEHSVVVTPTGDGQHYIHVFVRAGNLSEAMAIPMPVGKNQTMSKPITAVKPQTMPDGRQVMSIPSQP